MKLLTRYNLGKLELKNRVVMPPMCMYSAGEDAMATEFHKTHYETRAIGGVGLIIVEATSVLPEGRISDQDLGLWNDDQIQALKMITNRIKYHGSKAGIQLAHAGRKHTGLSSMPKAPSAIAFDENSRIPEVLSKEDIKNVIKAFADSAKRSVLAGFDFIEIHSAHGYLLNEFLSPISNHRDDEYGGCLENRSRLLIDVIKAVKKVIPKNMPLGIRVSASDYMKEGLNCDDMVKIVNMVSENLDIVHVSSGGTKNVPIQVYPGYQLQFSEQIKRECKIPTIAVGLITTTNMAEEALMNQRCDLVAFGRELLRNPYLVLNSYAKSGLTEELPRQYRRSYT